MTAGLTIALTWLAALGSGLIAGAFFAFSSFVMGALGRLPAPQGIAAMQSINIVVINRWFLGALFGTAVAALALLVLALLDWAALGALPLVLGAVLYLAGCILVTMFGNVPLNNALAKADPASPAGAELWQRYLRSWTAWNHVRTIASLAAAVAFILALR